MPTTRLVPWSSLALKSHSQVLFLRRNTRPRRSTEMHPSGVAMKSAAVASLIMCFAAGADIVEMSSRTYMECYKSDMFDAWEGVAKTNKPVIAAVNGVFAPPHVFAKTGLPYVPVARFRTRRWLRARYDVRLHSRWRQGKLNTIKPLPRLHSLSRSWSSS